jgi:hypothetical protein
MGGRRAYAVAGERDWLLARLAARPDVTLRLAASRVLCLIQVVSSSHAASPQRGLSLSGQLS